MKIIKNLIYLLLSAALLYCLAKLIMITMNYLHEIKSLVWFIIAIPISFILLVLISTILLKIVTAFSRFNSNLIIVNIVITLGIFYGIEQIYFLWKGSDFGNTRQIVIAIYGTLCLMSGFGNILTSMNKTLIVNNVSEKMI